MTTSTPWGPAQTTDIKAEGITWYSTSSHGGYHVSAARLRQMPEALRDFSPFAGRGWYEEDCDCAVVILAFPKLYTAGQIRSAVHTARANVRISDTIEDLGWKGVVAWLEGTPEGQALLETTRLYDEQHAALWEVGSMGTNGTRQGWDVCLTRPKDGARRWVAFPAYPERRWYSDGELEEISRQGAA